MGNTKMRKFIKNDNKWTDKEAPRHSHDFSIEGVAYVRVLGSRDIRQFHIMKCSLCNSFHTIPVDGNQRGVVPCKEGLAKLYFISTSKLLNMDKRMRCVDAIEFNRRFIE